MRLPSYRRHASGQARVTISGKDYLLGPYNSKESKREYSRLISEYVASGRSPSFGIPQSELTITELVAAFRKHAVKYYGEGPTSEYIRCKPPMTALNDLYGPTPAIEFGPVQYKAVRAHMQLPVVLTNKDGSKRKITRTRRYVNVCMKRIRHIMRWAAGEGMIPASIFETLKCIDPLKAGRCDSPDKDDVKPVDQATIDATVAQLPKVVGDMVRLQLLLGCRPGELCSITPSLVNRTGDVWEINLAKHKTAWRGKSRTIYVGPKAQKILKPYLLRNADVCCFSPAEATKQRLQAKHDARVTSMSCGNKPGTNKKTKPLKEPGTSYNTQSYGGAIRYAAIKAKVTPWSPNQLRHAALTNLRKSDGLESASIIAGHSDVGITQVYAESDRQKAIEVVRRIG